jgi:hypothetical protein
LDVSVRKRGKDLKFAPNEIEMRHTCIGAIPRLSDNICDIMASHWSNGTDANGHRLLPSHVRVVPHKVGSSLSNYHLPSFYHRLCCCE